MRDGQHPESGPALFSLALRYETTNCIADCEPEYRAVFTSSVCKRCRLSGWLDCFGSHHRICVLPRDLVHYVQTDSDIRAEDVCRQADVFAGVLCCSTIGVFFGSLDGEAGCKTLTMMPKSPEPIGHRSSTVADNVANTARLSFFVDHLTAP